MVSQVTQLDRTSSTSVGLSIERNTLIGQQLSAVRNVGGYELYNRPGGGELVGALVIIGAILTDGALAIYLAPELTPVFAL